MLRFKMIEASPRILRPMPSGLGARPALLSAPKLATRP